jgi:hypothetical protein
MAENKPSGLPRKAQPAQAARQAILKEKKTGFRPSKAGVCEAQLWEFTGPSKFLAEDEETPVERIAAASLDQALQFVRGRYPDFIICKAVAIGMIAMLSGSPLD